MDSLRERRLLAVTSAFPYTIECCHLKKKSEKSESRKKTVNKRRICVCVNLSLWVYICAWMVCMQCKWMEMGFGNLFPNIFSCMLFFFLMLLVWYILFAISKSIFVGFSWLITWLSYTSANTLAPFFFLISTLCNNKSIVHIIPNGYVYFATTYGYVYVAKCWANARLHIEYAMDNVDDHYRQFLPNTFYVHKWMQFKCKRKPTFDINHSVHSVAFNHNKCIENKVTIERPKLMDEMRKKMSPFQNIVN